MFLHARSHAVCNGKLDCISDGSDEKNCSVDDFVDCGDGTRVHRSLQCDNFVDCKSAFDEINCKYNIFDSIVLGYFPHST